MSNVVEQLVVLATTYGRYPYASPNGVGFADRDQVPEALYPTIEEAIAAEAKEVRKLMVDEHNEILRLQSLINNRLVHLGVLES